MIGIVIMKLKVIVILIVIGGMISYSVLVGIMFVILMVDSIVIMGICIV